MTTEFEEMEAFNAQFNKKMEMRKTSNLVICEGEKYPFTVEWELSWFKVPKYPYLFSRWKKIIIDNNLPCTGRIDGRYRPYKRTCKICNGKRYVSKAT